MKRIIRITLIALVISVARPTELQAWSFSNLSTNKKILSVVAALGTAFGIYWLYTLTKAKPAAQMHDTQEYTSTNTFWNRRTQSIFDDPQRQQGLNWATPDQAATSQNQHVRTPLEKPSGPIPTQKNFNFADTYRSTRFILDKVQEFVSCDLNRIAYYSNYNNWGIRLSLEKINVTTLKISFSIWKPTGEGLDGICAIFNKTNTGWTLNGNSHHAHTGIVSTDTKFTTNEKALLGSFNALCSLVKERLN